jgi:zinc protease
MRLLLTLLLAAPLLRAEGYAVLVSRQTLADPGWEKVVAALVAAHGAKVVPFEASVAETRSTLVVTAPRHLCWVARPDELGPGPVYRMHALANGLDEDPYPDCRWGIITGRSPNDALRLVAPAPLVIRNVGASTAFAAECVEQGWWFDEFKAGERWIKEAGGEARRADGAKDSTADIAARLNEGKTDLWITSGHATEENWEPGYRYRNGTFVHRGGVVTGKALDGSLHPVRSPNPKVYLPIGNCLMGNIPGKADCMGLAYLSTAGVRTMVGYVVPTWFGYAGWGVLDYFLEQPGRFTVSEAWLANHHALIWRLAEAKAGRAPAGDVRGLQFDRDKTVLYGDPKWDARLAPGTRRWGETLREVAPGEWEWVVTPAAGAQTFEPVNTNGSQRGGRPLVTFLPRHAAGWEILQGAEHGLVAADDFLLLPNPGTAVAVPERIVLKVRRR